MSSKLSTHILIAAFLFIQIPCGLAAEVFFSPSTDCEDHISKEVDHAKTEIVASVYSINNKKIVNSLIAAHRRGVAVRILTDRVQAAGRSSQVLTLKDAGLNIRVHTKHKIEHNKFAWFDGKTAVNGSFNWTEPASQSNSENCVLFNEANVVSAFKQRFEELWKMNSEEGSNKRFAAMRAKSRNRSTASTP